MPVSDSLLPPGLAIRPIRSAAQTFEAHDVLSEVWGGDRSGMPPNLLRALVHAGNYAVGLYDGDRMVGASVAFFAEPASRALHSHITGILPAYRARHLGLALKENQRAWALEHGLERITWTFDPLVARNARFNLHTLGARVVEYLVNHYGVMDDGINRGDESDRVLVSWELVSRELTAASAVVAEADVVAAVPVPADVESLRREAPADAAAWRRDVREQFLRHLGGGLVVIGFDGERGYLFGRV